MGGGGLYASRSTESWLGGMIMPITILLLLLLILESTQTEHFTPNCGALFRMSGRYLKKHYCPMYMAKKFEL